MEALATGRTMALIAQLPQDQAEAVVLRVVVGLDAKSAAKTLGKRPGAVRTAAHRGLKQLAELLGADGADWADFMDGQDDADRRDASAIMRTARTVRRPKSVARISTEYRRSAAPGRARRRPPV